MENLIFNESNVIEIELEDLKRTQSLSEYSGQLPKNRPVEAAHLIEIIAQMCNKANLNPIVEPIWASKADSKRVMVLDPDKTGKMESWLLQRLITRIKLPALRNDVSESSIAIGYNTSGFTLAWGSNVHICQNQSIFGDNIITTYGNTKNKMNSLEKILELFQSWVDNAVEKFEADNKIFRALMDKSVSANVGVPRLIGELQMAAVKAAYIDSQVQAPLNIGQMSQFSKNLLTDHPDLLNSSEPISLWSLYNHGTSILKAKTTDIATIWQDNLAFGNFFIDKFKIMQN